MVETAAKSEPYASAAAVFVGVGIRVADGGRGSCGHLVVPYQPSLCWCKAVHEMLERGAGSQGLVLSLKLHYFLMAAGKDGPSRTEHATSRATIRKWSGTT